MIKQLQLCQLYTYMKNSISAYIVDDNYYNERQVIYTIKIAGIPFYIVIRLYNILNDITRDWTTYAREELINMFQTYVRDEIDDDTYTKICNKLNLPQYIKNNTWEFDIVYLTDFDFKPCTLEECGLTGIYKKLSDEELFNLCQLPLTDTQKEELAAL